MTAAQRRAVRTRATLLGAAANAKKGTSLEVALKHAPMKNCCVSEPTCSHAARRPFTAASVMQGGGTGLFSKS
eukprot:8701170-Lingulodinium_polyedra.AAC.1